MQIDQSAAAHVFAHTHTHTRARVCCKCIVMINHLPASLMPEKATSEMREVVTDVYQTVTTTIKCQRRSVRVLIDSEL